MAAMTGGADCGSARLAVTRGGRHRVAQHMPAALRRAAGQVGLVPSLVGLRTAACGTDARFLGVDGTELAVSGAAGTKRTPVITIRAAEFAGITPGAVAGVYQPAAPLDLDVPLMIELGTASLLAQWHGLGAQALSRLAAGSPGDKPTGPVLWLEHFDAGMTAAAISYGTWPGDDHITDSYLYVGPHDGPPPGDPAFWNAPSGSAGIFGQVGTVAEAAGLRR